MPTANDHTQSTSTIRPRVKLWVESDSQSVMCGGLCDILRSVETTGSIKHAAAEIGRSYRFIWSRIKETEEALGHRLVETQVGGRDGQRSTLTPLAVDLLAEFETVRDEVCQIVDQVFADRLSQTLDRHGVTPKT